MSNTYFAINTIDKFEDDGLSRGYTNKMRLSLTKFMGGDKGLQITCNTHSTISSQTGCGHVTLNKEQASRLRNALNEFLDDKISSTGYEVSKYTDKDNDLG